MAFGAYDKAVHWLDGATGDRLLPDFPVGDIIKGSVTVDPDGYPLSTPGRARRPASRPSPWTAASRPSCGSSRPKPWHRRCGTTTGTARRS
ncbi:MAG: hypothetical protein U5R31_11795 [Acidimicrobiia bacterium]|nr:hypothetical protein [Acidimicrobiia bacterium]